ncbi:MAG TPA: helix-turn-helix domain-containing protein [Candidatus Blautia avicola]|uniref:Helix-turn-helix domain-containing protein n=1 Tax=Candidatus Blautia avicola TaxID=2838483 RepID=A0A9D2QV05_9FIRM|nr:helix-turn-helix domain-containing protein [Candidatus Blautia avicola]
MSKEENGQLLLLEKQKRTRKNVIEQYIKFRKDRKLTQEELAGIIGVSRPSISRFESGEYNPTLDMMVKIAEGLELNLDISLKQKKGEENEQ